MSESENGVSHGDCAAQRRSGNGNSSKNSEKNSGQDYSNVYIRAGEYEVSIECNESLDETTEEALRAMIKTKAMDTQGTIPNKGLE